MGKIYEVDLSVEHLVGKQKIMTLSVSAYVRGPNGEMEFIEPSHPSEELAGFESYRQTLYASHAARSLGLSILPTLDGGNVYADGEDVGRLLAEAELALANIDRFEAELGVNAESLRPRFENIAADARRASDAGGGVVIW